MYIWTKSTHKTETQRFFFDSSRSGESFVLDNKDDFVDTLNRAKGILNICRSGKRGQVAHSTSNRQHIMSNGYLETVTAYIRSMDIMRISTGYLYLCIQMDRTNRCLVDTILCTQLVSVGVHTYFDAQTSTRVTRNLILDIHWTNLCCLGSH